MPGAFGDAFRAIDALPGVIPILSGLPYYFIRGAPPGNTGYLIDGIRVPLLFHFGVFRAVIHPGLIERVDFYAGGFPAKYGRYAGGVINGETKSPADRVHGEWDVSLFHAGALVEAPFGGDRGTVTAAGRYGYPGLLLSLLVPKVFLQYGDHQARVSWKTSDTDTFSVFTFGSHDATGREDGELKRVISTGFHRVDMRWDRSLGKTGRVRTAVTLGLDQTGSSASFAVRDWLVGVRSEMELDVSSTVRIRAGADALFDHYTLASNSNDDTARNFPTRNDVTSGIFADAIIKLSRTVEIVPGARIDYFEAKSSIASGGGAVPTFDPRLATRVRLTPRLTWLTTTGITHQPPSFLVPVPGLQLGTLSKGVQTAVQTSQGLEIGLPLDFTFAPTAFLHNYLNLTDTIATCGLGGLETDKGCIDERVRGRTYGLEVLLRRPLTKQLTGWVAYTLSRSTRDTHPIGSPSRSQTIPSEFDRPHVLNVIGAYDLGRNWRLGGRLLYYSGRPYSNRFQGVSVPPFNNQRLPDFFRIDVRLEKRWLTKRGHVAFVAEGLNVTASQEVLDVTCTPAPRGTSALDRCEPDTKNGIPLVVPSIGVEGAF